MVCDHWSMYEADSNGEPILNSKPRTVALILARMTSARLPGKGLMEIAGKPLLWHIAQRLQRVASLGQIAIATTNRPEDQPLVEFARANKILSFAWDGDVDDVLGRIVHAGAFFSADVIVTISGDCPLLDPQFTEGMIRALLQSGKEFTRVKPGFKCLHEGIGVITLSAWHKLDSVSGEPYQREHAGIYLKEHPDFLAAAEIVPEEIFQRDGYRISVDNTADLAFMRTVYERLYLPGKIVELRDVVKLLDHEPDIRAINAHVAQKGIHERSKRIAFWIDAGAQYGMGHLRRCLALARELHEKQHCGVLFLTVENGATARLIQEEGFSVRFLQTTPGSEQQLQHVINYVKAFRADAVILDQKAPVSRECIAALHRCGCTTVVIDDISSGSQAANLVVLPVAHHDDFDATDFYGRVVCGASYVLLNRQFADVDSLHRNEQVARCRILISMGGSDPEGFTLDAVKAVSPMPADVTVVTGPFFMFEMELAAILNDWSGEIEVKQNVTDMAELFSQTDLAILSFGVTVYEAARMGVPSVVLPRSRADAECAARLTKIGICRSLDYRETVSANEVRKRVNDLLLKPGLRKTMSRTATALIDGQGVRRVAEVIMTELSAEMRTSRKRSRVNVLQMMCAE